MFKRKLKKAALIALSCLFIAATSGGKSIAEQDRYPADTCNISAHNATSLCSHVFDENGLCTCLPNLTEDELALAPRIQLNKHAAPYVKDYLKENSFFLEKLRPKSIPCFAIIDSVFTDYDLPVELKYLAVIESNLDKTSTSSAGAAGIWQLMPVPARQFGLKVGGKNDERKQTYKSTVAAAKCLTYLHNMFGDWLLTVAAYNSGPGRVLSAIKRSGSRNFWALQSFLPEETRKHVKKFIAMHYFFEGHGSLATLTKAETQSHITAVAKFIEKYKEEPITETLTITSKETAIIAR